LSKPVLSNAAGGVEGGSLLLWIKEVKERASTGSAKTEKGCFSLAVTTLGD